MVGSRWSYPMLPEVEMSQCHSCKHLRIKPVFGNAYIWCGKSGVVAFAADSECSWYEERRSRNEAEKRDSSPLCDPENQPHQ